MKNISKLIFFGIDASHRSNTCGREKLPGRHGIFSVMIDIDREIQVLRIFSLPGEGLTSQTLVMHNRL
jgi:hypothetical protein